MLKKTYFQNIVIVLITMFLACENKPHQEFIYFPDGTVKAIIEDSNISEDVKKISSYYPNGKIREEGFYDMQSKISVSEIRHYDSSGVLEKISSKLVEGKPDGKVTFFDKNGDIEQIKFYKSGISYDYNSACGGIYDMLIAGKDTTNFGSDTSHTVVRCSSPVNLKIGNEYTFKLSKKQRYDKLIIRIGVIKDISIYNNIRNSSMEMSELMNKTIFVKLDTIITNQYEINYVIKPLKIGKNIFIAEFTDSKQDNSICLTTWLEQEFIVK